MSKFEEKVSGSRLEARRGGQIALFVFVGDVDEALSYALKLEETLVEFDDRRGSKLVARTFRLTYENGEGEKIVIQLTVELKDEWVTVPNSIQIKKNGEDKPMNTKFDLSKNIVVTYSASEQDELAAAWLQGLAGGRGLQIFTCGNTQDEDGFYVLHVELHEGPYPEAPDKVSFGLSVSGWDASPRSSLLHGVRRIIQDAPSVEEGVLEAVACFGKEYALLTKFYATHDEFGDCTDETGEFLSGLTDEDFLTVIGISREAHAKLTRGDTFDFMNHS